MNLLKYTPVFFGFVVVLFFSQLGHGLSTPAYLKLDRAPDAGQEEGPATFPHLIHQRMFMCYSCHPSIFSYGRDLYTHKDFDEGRFCAECHNGKISWHIDDADCQVCHYEGGETNEEE